MTSLPGRDQACQSIYKVDAFFEMVKNLTLGAEWFVFKNDLYQTAGEKYDVGGWSVFGRYTIKPDKLAALRPLRRLHAEQPRPGPRHEPGHRRASTGPPSTRAGRSSRTSGSIATRTAPATMPAPTKDSDVVFNLTFFLSFWKRVDVHDQRQRRMNMKKITIIALATLASPGRPPLRGGQDDPDQGLRHHGQPRPDPGRGVHGQEPRARPSPSSAAAPAPASPASSTRPATSPTAPASGSPRRSTRPGTRASRPAPSSSPSTA
ncbi:MAG: hypothetical protein M0C28_48960 [Candidatus Moduliflexus flocculans]|nr:hypothetical protein [Candidatus Moduliflexus flocculans]